MSDTTEILIGDSAGSHVLITPLGRSQPGLFDDRDGNGIDCEITVVAGAFRGTVRAVVGSEECSVFFDDLARVAKALDGAATLTAQDQQVALSIAAGESGTIAVTGEAADEAGGGNLLRFVFAIEPSTLVAVCESLEHLLAAFPVIGVADAAPGREA